MFLRPGKGEIKVNDRAFENYFPTESARAMVRQPLLATETADKFDVLILADGGGVAGQAGAARLGIARALVEFNAELRATAEEARLSDARPARARAQEVRPEGRAQAVPVLQTLVIHGECCGCVQPGAPRCKLRLPSARANLALDRAAARRGSVRRARRSPAKSIEEVVCPQYR